MFKYTTSSKVMLFFLFGNCDSYISVCTYDWLVPLAIKETPLSHPMEQIVSQLAVRNPDHFHSHLLNSVAMFREDQSLEVIEDTIICSAVNIICPYIADANEVIESLHELVMIFTCAYSQRV